MEKIHTFTLLKPPNTVNLRGELLWKFEIRLPFDSFEKFWVSEHGCLHKNYPLTISASFFFRAIILELYAQSWNFWNSTSYWCNYLPQISVKSKEVNWGALVTLTFFPFASRSSFFVFRPPEHLVVFHCCFLHTSSGSLFPSLHNIQT